VHVKSQDSNSEEMLKKNCETHLEESQWGCTVGTPYFNCQNILRLLQSYHLTWLWMLHNFFPYTFILNHSKESFTGSQIHQLLGGLIPVTAFCGRNFEESV